MKAEQILRASQGQIAGALVRLHSLTGRMECLANVADDVATGVAMLEGLDTINAKTLQDALQTEVEQLLQLASQITSGYAHLVRLASMLPRPQAATDDGVVVSERGAIEPEARLKLA